MKPHVGSEANLLSSYFPVQWSNVKHIWNNSYLHCGCIWSEIFQFKQLERLLLSNCLNWNIYCDDYSSLLTTVPLKLDTKRWNWNVRLDSIVLRSNQMILFVQFGINKHQQMFERLHLHSLYGMGNSFQSLPENLRVFIYSKLHAKSIDYLY